MKIILTAIFAFTLFTAKSQTTKATLIKMTVNCHPTLGFITNVPGEYRSVDFIFENEEEASLFVVENFSRHNFLNLMRLKDTKSISRAKLVLPNYKAKPYDLIYGYSKSKELQFYYIVKNHDEETAVNKLIR
ncbi:MAG: hypothetical protein ABI185_11260 [Ginsengibacter sp.]